MTITLDDILREGPKFHVDSSGRSVSWGLADEVLRYIAGLCNASMQTLEIGAGFSTLVFALCGARHIAIVPDGDQIRKIRQFAEMHAVDLSNVEFHCEYSQIALPRLELEKPLDVVLIDGDHAFPAPFIDYFYTSVHMRAASRLIVDDTQIWTGAILHRFLCDDSSWRLERRFRRTSVFEMVTPVDKNISWTDQRFVAKRSPSPLRLAASDAVYLARRGRWSELNQKIREKLARR